MANHNIYHLFRQRFADESAFICTGQGEVQYTYGDLERLSAEIARQLASMGINPGDRVIVQVEKSAMSLMVYFGCLRAGFVYLPLNTAYQRHEIEYFVTDAEPALVICDPANEELYQKLTRCPVLTLDGEGRGSLQPIPESYTADTVAGDIVTNDADDIAVILYTSGTTGQPKGAMISHGNLAANGLTLHEAWRWQPGDILLHALPIFHIHGLFVATHLAVLNSSPMLFLNRFDPAAVIAALPNATVYMGVPTNYTRLLANSSFDKQVCRNMRLFTSGSAPLLVQTFKEFEARTGHCIVERYGMTETGMNTSNPVDGQRKPGTVGPPLPGVEARIVDSSNHQVPVLETGDLLIRGANVFKGYWRKPGKTAQEFDPDGFFRTGDLALVDEDGYISLVGRNKDLIISGGLNVYPKEIESVIDQIPGVMESAVIGIPDTDFGEAVTAVVVQDQDASLDEAIIISHLKTTLANFKVAKHVFFVTELPRNTMGKVQKNVLRDQFSQHA
ncbi:MAG: AMP-binding protein [Pseudomonadales bacterium]